MAPWPHPSTRPCSGLYIFSLGSPVIFARTYYNNEAVYRVVVLNLAEITNCFSGVRQRTAKWPGYDSDTHVSRNWNRMSWRGSLGKLPCRLRRRCRLMLRVYRWPWRCRISVPLAAGSRVSPNVTLCSWITGTSWYIDWLICRFIDWLVDWSIDWLIDWSIDWLIDWSIDEVVDWLIDWLIFLRFKVYWIRLIPHGHLITSCSFTDLFAESLTVPPPMTTPPSQVSNALSRWAQPRFFSLLAMGYSSKHTKRSSSTALSVSGYVFSSVRYTIPNFSIVSCATGSCAVSHRFLFQHIDFWLYHFLDMRKTKNDTFHLFFILYYPVVLSHFLHSLGNYTRGAIFPETCKINQSSIDFHCKPLGWLIDWR